MLKIKLLLLSSFISITHLLPQEMDWLSVYADCKEASIHDRFFKHQQIESLILSLDKSIHWKYSKVGESIEGRNIYLLKIGNGPKKILLWSQMHGDEPTATMALMDMINFFEMEDLLPSWKDRILNELSIYIVPMLNPDGAERFDRRNAAFIDLNRDARRLQSPESLILKRMVDSLTPEFGFNLHDQSRYYAAGFQSDSTASFSFLAPPYDQKRSINTIRLTAMKLIAGMNEYLQKQLPEKVGRYPGGYEPRAFGDNITGWGTSTILIEVGGLKNDPEKQQLRKIHFGLLLHAFDCISTECYHQYTKDDYDKIPSNSRVMEDLILRNVWWDIHGHRLLVDLAMKREEIEIKDHRQVVYRGQLTDVGDLSTSRAYTDLKFDSVVLVKPKVYPRIFNPEDIPESTELQKMIREGYAVAYIDMNEIPLVMQEGPVRWVKPGDVDSWSIDLGGNPSFYLRDLKSGQLLYLVNNGLVFRISTN